MQIYFKKMLFNSKIQDKYQKALTSSFQLRAMVDMTTAVACLYVTGGFQIIAPKLQDLV